VWPKISIVMICHNQAAHLEEAIHSLLDQHYPALEFLVIDVGSTDGSVEIIKKHSDQLAWWSNELAAGPAAQALNKGFAKSTGTILTWLTGRDRLAPGSLFTVAQQFLLHDTDLVAGRGARADNRNPLALPLHRSVLALGRIQPLPLPELLDLDRCWLQGWFFQPPEVFFSRKIFERAGGSLREELRHAMDYDLWIRMARAGARILPLPEVLAISRAAPDWNQAEAEDSCGAELRAVNAGHQAPSSVSA
jgi:glycosyltransferase involved in cell wall biosynthesis